MRVSSKSHERKEQEDGQSRVDGEKRERKLSEVNIRAVSRTQNELIAG
jgi:hypothetical protein